MSQHTTINPVGVSCRVSPRRRPAWRGYTYSDALNKSDNQRSLSGESRACFVNDSRAFY